MVIIVFISVPFCVTSRDGVVVLAAGMNPDVSSNVHYCIGEYKTLTGVQPNLFDSVEFK